MIALDRKDDVQLEKDALGFNVLLEVILAISTCLPWIPIALGPSRRISAGDESVYRLMLIGLVVERDVRGVMSSGPLEQEESEELESEEGFGWRSGVE